MKKLIEKIGYTLSYIYPLKLDKKINSLINYLYTGWISRNFKSFEGFCERSIIVHNPQCISVGKNTRIYKRTRIKAFTYHTNKYYKPIIEIGDNSSIGSDCFLSAINKIKIGNNVAITARTLILDNVHGNFKESDFTFKQNAEIPDVFLQKLSERELNSNGPVIIEDNVHIGENCVILSGVTIGHNSVISANSVILKNIPPYSLVSGNPGRILMTFGKKKTNNENPMV